MKSLDPQLQKEIEALCQQVADRTLLYQTLAQCISDYRMQLDQEAFNEQMAAPGHHLTTDRFFSWLTGGHSSSTDNNKPVSVTIGGRCFLIDFTGTDPSGKKTIC